MKSRYHLLLLSLIILLFYILFLVSSDFRFFVFRSTDIDSIGHIISFFALMWVLHNILKLPLLNTALTLVFYGALTELGQYYLGFRNGELSDFFSDVVGILLFCLFRWSVLVMRTRSS